MSKETKNYPQPFTTSRLYSLDELAAFRQIGKRYGVKMKVLSRGGQQFRHVNIDPLSGEERIYEGLVPKGKVYTQLYAESISELQLFYQETGDILVQQQNSDRIKQV